MSDLVAQVVTMLERGITKKKICKKLHVSKKLVKGCKKYYCNNIISPLKIAK